MNMQVGGERRRSRALANPFRFSTKFTDESFLVNFGLRLYSPSLGRFVNRAPEAKRALCSIAKIDNLDIAAYHAF